jgi:Xaa-Pro aminopeptidase
MVLAIEPGAYWDGGGGLRVEDNFLITADGVEKLSSYPDDFRSGSDPLGSDPSSSRGHA